MVQDSVGNSIEKSSIVSLLWVC